MYRQERIISGKGTAGEQFGESLRGLAVDSFDQLYAVGDSVCKVFSSSGELRKSWATGRAGLCVAVEDDKVYVGEEGQLEIYDPSGKLLDCWKNPEKLGRVTAIGLSEDSIFLADALHRCIRKFDRQGTHLQDIGADNRMKGFNIPNGSLDFSLDRNGILHACNPGKHRVERYGKDGQLLGHFGGFDGRSPQGFPGCCNPTNVTVSAQGQVYVTEKAAPRAKVYDSDGQLLEVIATDFFHPASKNIDLAVDSKGRVYLADTVRLQIGVFVKEA